MAKFKTPEQLNAEADALLKKHQDKDLEDGFYDEDLTADDDDLPPAETDKDSDTDAEKDDAKTADNAEKDDKKKDKKAGKKPEKEEEEEEEEKEGDEKEEDAFGTEGLDEKSEKRIKDAQRAFHKKAGEAKRLKQWAEQVEEENKALRDRADRGKSTSNVAKPKVQLSEERVKQLQTEYPDLADFFQSVRDTQIENANLREEVVTGLGKVDHQTRETRFMSAVKKRHSDAEEIQVSDEWSGWLDSQPTYIQRAINDGATSEEVAEIINMFKDNTGWGSDSADEKSSTSDSEEASGESAPGKLSKKEQAKQIAAPNLPNAARQHKPGQGSAKTYSAAEIERTRLDPKKQQWLISEEGEKWQQDVVKAMREGRITQ